ncbi:MAG: hypothetical protein WA003_12335, partial [Desulfuromonadaceae bacterium]
ALSFIFLWLLGDLIQVMPKCQQRVKNHYPWPGIAHHLAHLLPPLGLIAMDGALGAGGFIVLKGALLNTLQSVVK